MFERPLHQRIAQVLGGLNGKAIHQLQHRQGWLERCMQAMAMTLPKALVWQRVRNLHKVLTFIETVQPGQ